MTETDDPEARFAKALVKLLKFFNLIDTNVGLCLSHLSNPSDPVGAYPQLAAQTTQQRFEALSLLISK